MNALKRTHFHAPARALVSALLFVVTLHIGGCKTSPTAADAVAGFQEFVG